MKPEDRIKAKIYAAGAIAKTYTGIEGVKYTQMTDDEVRLDVLKAAMVNPDLYNTMRQLMVDHPYPARLDEHARRLRRIFMELDHGTKP